MTARELGVFVLGGVLGAITAAIVRILSTGTRANGGNPMLWQVALLVCWTPQGLFIFRNDLGYMISQILSVIVLPTAVFVLITTMFPGSLWRTVVTHARGES